MPVRGVQRGPGCVQKFVHKEMPHLMHKPNFSKKRALGASYSMARSYCSGGHKNLHPKNKRKG